VTACLCRRSLFPRFSIEYLSWRSGYLVFHDVPLAEAVAEFNRYNVRKIEIDDSAVAAIKVSGKFRSTNFEAFVRLLEDGFPVRAQTTDDQIILTSANTGVHLCKHCLTPGTVRAGRVLSRSAANEGNPKLSTHLRE